jgi:hypothetical protein
VKEIDKEKADPDKNQQIINQSANEQLDSKTKKYDT